MVVDNVIDAFEEEEKDSNRQIGMVVWFLMFLRLGL
jgi:hypothetical protein